MNDQRIVKLVWGKLKPYKSLLHHMIDVGSCTEVLMHDSFRTSTALIAADFGISVESTIQIVSYFAALHDIGKCHPQFQRMAQGTDADVYNELRDLLRLDKAVPTHFRHEIYSKKVLDRIWQKSGFFSDEIIDNISCVVSLHHQGKTGNGNEMTPAFQTLFFPIQEELEQIIRSMFLPEIPQLICSDWSAVCILVEGIIICSDWIASDKWFEMIDNSNLIEYMDTSKTTAETVISSIGICETELPDIESMSDLFPYMTDKSLRPMQKCIAELKQIPCFAILEDITGSGKTEAAVYLALKMASKYKKHGLYFALPTAATSNQMFYRLDGIFQRFNTVGFRLIHGTAWAESNTDCEDKIQLPVGEDSIGQEWLAPCRKGLLASNAVGTVDQAMMAVMQIKYSVLRMLGLTEKVLIIDEIHAYDAYMSNIIERLLEWCSELKIPVILLSATLPLKKKQAYIKHYGAKPKELQSDYPLFTLIYEDGSIDETKIDAYRSIQYQFEIMPYLDDYEKIADIAIKMIVRGGNICVMLNTINEAQIVYKLIKNNTNEDIEVLLFHARFTVEDRQKIEQDCMNLYSKEGNRPNKSILICTQVVEQSLDIDFDAMITQLAPIDLLIQRAGRIHRHCHNRNDYFKMPRMIILTPQNKSKHTGTYYVYAPYILNKTVDFLMKDNRKSFAVPENVREAVEFVYNDLNINMNYDEWQKLWFTDQQKQNNAMGYEIGKPDKKYYYETEHITEAALWGEDPGDADPSVARTRDGQSSVRVVLASEKLLQKYEKEWFKPEIQREMLMNSVSLNIRTSLFPDKETKGRMKGYIILHSETNEFEVGTCLKIIKDSTLGVIYNDENAK